MCQVILSHTVQIAGALRQRGVWKEPLQTVTRQPLEEARLYDHFFQ